MLIMLIQVAMQVPLTYQEVRLDLTREHLGKASNSLEQAQRLQTKLSKIREDE
jgi:hypothetical protein